MKKVLSFLAAVVLSGCAGFENASVSTDEPLAHQDSATMNAIAPKVLTVRDGYLYNATTDISKWEASHGNMTVGRENGAMIVDFKGVGSDWEQLMRKFSALDFAEAPIIMVKARVDESSADSLKMRIDLIDEDGLATNYSPQERYIRSRATSKWYKFVYAGNWVQNWPSRADVNAKKIVGVRINFNGGGPNYSGKIIIEEMFATDGKKKNANPLNYVLFDFSEGTAGWWSANSIAVSPEETDGKEVMKLKLDDCGPKWEGFGYRFDQKIDLSKTPIMVVKLKADQPGKLRIDLRDAKDYATNKTPLLIDFPASQTFTNVVFDYSGKFLQTWPNNQVVDSTTISSMACFVNPPENPSYTGTVMIDDITLMSVEEYNKIK
ncbi:MAG: hypothetical protein MUF42_05755 [Cytophagaceae bacterium]|jgi:hypothetical protein|nr:hypothetical protein [Cytophagaceae bacterium]